MRLEIWTDREIQTSQISVLLNEDNSAGPVPHSVLVMSGFFVCVLETQSCVWDFVGQD